MFLKLFGLLINTQTHPFNWNSL